MGGGEPLWGPGFFSNPVPQTFWGQRDFFYFWGPLIGGEPIIDGDWVKT